MPNMRWASNLVVTAHADMAAAELILEAMTRSDPEALDVATLFGKKRPSVRRAFFSRLNASSTERRGFTSMIGLWPSEMLCARIGIIGRVHKVVEVLDPPERQGATWES